MSLETPTRTTLDELDLPAGEVPALPPSFVRTVAPARVAGELRLDLLAA